MRKSSVLSGELTASEVAELNSATEQMRQNRLWRFGIVGDADGYLKFLEERQKLFSSTPRPLKKLSIEKSHIL